MARLTSFRGTGTALVTPFKRNGAVDELALQHLVELQIKAGVEGIVPLGTTGENPTLSAEEKDRILDIVVEKAAGKTVVIAGAGSNSTSATIETARRAADSGVDALLVVGPYYNKPTQEGYFRHYMAIAEAVELPMIIYNVPGRTGGNIEPATLLKLADEIPSVIGVKEASGNMSQIMEIARNKPRRFSLLSGDDAFTLPLMAVGGEGCISVVANEVPDVFSGMVRSALQGKWDKALKLHNRLLPLMNANFLEANPIPVKAALAMMGLIEEVYRLPLVDMDPKRKQQLRSVLESLKLV